MHQTTPEYEPKESVVDALLAGSIPPRPSPRAAWGFLNWAIPGGAFSVMFVDQNKTGPEMHKQFTVDEFREFETYLRQLNNEKARFNVYFDPNCAGYCGPENRNNTNCFDYIAVALEHTSPTLDLSELQEKIHADFVFPERRPLGVPMPTALWNTVDGCAALWRMTRPMGVSQGLEVGDTLAAAVENGDFFTTSQHYLQLPYTVCWPTAQQLEEGKMPESTKLEKPFSIKARPAEHDWYSFRWLVNNADAGLAEFDY